MTRAQRWTLLAAIVASGIVFLDSTVVNLALKRIGQELPTATSLGVLEGQAYVGSGYLAVLAALLIIAGALADRYGRRRIFIIGLASLRRRSRVLCGIAPNLEILIVARLLQGAAGALLVPGLARDHHRRVRRRGPGPGLRAVGGVDLGADPARTDPRRAARRQRCRGGWRS